MAKSKLISRIGALALVIIALIELFRDRKHKKK